MAYPIPELILELREPAKNQRHLSELVDERIAEHSRWIQQEMKMDPLIPYEMAAIKTFLMRLRDDQLKE